MLDLIIKANTILAMLEGKTFYVVSFHSRLSEFPYVLEDRTLKTNEIIVNGTLIKILFNPSRNLSIDLKERPKFLIADNKIVVVRHLSTKDLVTQVILINH